MGITEINAALASIKYAFDIANIMNDSVVSLEAAEVKLKLADLIDNLADAKVKIAKFKEILSERDAEIQRLKGQLEKQGNILWETPYYFLIKENGEKDGPYCQKCYDSKRKLIRLQSVGPKCYWRCYECTSNYEDSTYETLRGL